MPVRLSAWARLLARTSLPVGSVPMVIMFAASLTAKVPAVTRLAVATCLSGAPLTNTRSGSAAIALVPMKRALNAASPPMVELNSVFQPEVTQTARTCSSWVPAPNRRTTPSRPGSSGW